MTTLAEDFSRQGELHVLISCLINVGWKKEKIVHKEKREGAQPLVEMKSPHSFPV